MSNNVAIFNYEQQQVRMVERKGEPWFVLADLCHILGLSNPTMVSKKLDEDETMRWDEDDERIEDEFADMSEPKISETPAKSKSGRSRKKR